STTRAWSGCASPSACVGATGSRRQLLHASRVSAIKSTPVQRRILSMAAQVTVKPPCRCPRETTLIEVAPPSRDRVPWTQPLSIVLRPVAFVPGDDSWYTAAEDTAISPLQGQKSLGRRACQDYGANAWRASRRRPPGRGRNRPGCKWLCSS